MKRFLKVALWVVGGAALVLIVLFVGALFERQAELAEMSDEDKAELREKLASGELQGDGVMDDVWEETGVSGTIAGVVAQLKNPRVQTYGGIAAGAVLLVFLATRLVRFARARGERKRKQADDAKLDAELDRIEADLKARPGARKRKGGGEPAPAAKEPFWARFRKAKPARVYDDETEEMPWEKAEDGASGGGAAVAGQVSSSSAALESYSARGKPSKKVDRPAERMARSGHLPGLSLPASDRPPTPDPIAAAPTPTATTSSDDWSSLTSSTAIPSVPEATPLPEGTPMPMRLAGVRPRDVEEARKLLTRHVTTAIAASDAHVGSQRLSQLIAVAEGMVRARPAMDNPRTAHLPAKVQLAIRMAEEMGRQARPGQDEDADLAAVMVDVVMGLREES